MSFSLVNPIFYDLEVFPGYFMAGFRLSDGTRYRYVVTKDDRSMIPGLLEFVEWARSSTWIGFNSNHYDDRVMTEFLKTLDPFAAYDISYRIIVQGEPTWRMDNDINSVDLMPILPGRISLKKIGVCLGHGRLQELPVPWHEYPDEVGQQILPGYNDNDLEITYKLFNQIRREVDLRVQMSEQYEVDLRSKGEATLAEIILLHEFTRLGGEGTKKSLNEAARASIAQYPYAHIKQPKWWDVLPRPDLHRLGLEIFNTAIPIINDRLSSSAMERTVFIGDRYYAMGVGGLHSVDGPGQWIPAEDEILFDIDVSSYYPSIILANELYPRSWGPLFLVIFRDIVNRRLAAKAAGDKTTADVLKIGSNGTYGKSSDPFSPLYDPQLTANVTLLGQLALLTLVDMLDGTANVVSANTDGLTVLVKRNHEAKFREIVSRWEGETGFNMEYVEYLGLWQKDVNNYIAKKASGALKKKGRFIDDWPDLRHTPNGNIIATAVANYIGSGTPVLKTISGCKDLNQFILTHNMTGGYTATWGGVKLGKVLRFYRSKASFAGPILKSPGEGDKGNEGIVPNSDSCVPVEDMPETFPSDVDLSWYINEAEKLIQTITIPKRRGMNAWAEVMTRAGLRPCMVDPNAKVLSRARVTYGETDFSSLPPGWVMGTGTGDGLIACAHEDGPTTVWFTDRPYPGKTRAKVEKEHSFTLYHGARVPLNQVVHYEVGPRADFDRYYTPAELKKVGR